MSSNMLLVLASVVLLVSVNGEEDCSEQVFADAKEALSNMPSSGSDYKTLEDMHTTLYQRHLHNGSRYLNFYFHKEITNGNNRYLLSRYFALHFYTPMMACSTYGGHLPEPKNEAEVTYIGNLVKEGASQPCVYLGMERLTDGRWHYMSDQKPAFTKFGAALDTRSNVNCVVLSRAANWLMDDSYCGNSVCHIVCQLSK